LIEVVAAKLGVAVAGEDFDDAVLDLGDRDIERAAAQVETRSRSASRGWGS
jgi:hypothetical protein